MSPVVAIVDLDGLPPGSVEALRGMGDGAHIWPNLQMAVVREARALPSLIANALSAAPPEVNRDRWAIIDGLERMLVEEHTHRLARAPNGNAALAAVAGGTTAVYPAYNQSGELVPGATRETPRGWMAAVNLSIGVGSPGEFQPSDPVNVATKRAAAMVPLVMAAGNARDLRRGPGAYSRWAKAPWIITVSALRDGALADDSAYGNPADPSYAPTVAAADDQLTVYHADTETVEEHRGTSIAAPVVTRQLAKLAAFCLTLRAIVLETRGIFEGVPRVGCGLIDFGIDSERMTRPSWPYGALPLIGVAREGATRLAAVTMSAGLDAAVLPNPAALRRMLVASARHVDGLGPHQVGAGEVSAGTTAIYLTQLDAGAYLRTVVGEGSRVDAAAAALDGVPLTDDTIADALTLWEAAEFWWLWDFRVARQLLGLTLAGDWEVPA